jgi:hypothetical protein
MKRKLLVAGCSITHGLETVHHWFSQENIQNSYGKFIADHLQADYVNIAYPGASNEMIFHRIVNALTTNDYTDCIIGWTSLHREAWENNNMTWTFNFNYGAFTDNNIDEMPFIKNHRLAKITSNVKEKLNDVYNYYNTLRVKLLTDNLENKFKNYRLLIQKLCVSKNIDLKEFTVTEEIDNLTKITGRWLLQGRHPNKQEHQQISKFLISNFYE